ncbi:NAD(P)H-hydrate dehydratase [Pseudochrobactrum sp. HB0163]|uniref:NAD(P)H-hydrate dehydratase n=1 Tax=Pseudochrobactrum sp. HB0163 TaxID=3450708 RepID=UPI003F6E2E98
MELLTPQEMAQADKLTIARGLGGYQLMMQAGAAVCQQILHIWPQHGRVAVLCGTGNNGGDGYVIARLLKMAGRDICCFAVATPQGGTDAAQAFADYQAVQGETEPLENFETAGFELIVDALLGAGLSRPVDGKIAACIAKVNQSGLAVCAVDLPSGVNGQNGQVAGVALKAQHTVTFFRKKPGHLLLPGRQYCGQVSLCDIGISPEVLAQIQPVLYENKPDLWRRHLPVASVETHKFRRGHVAVFSGGMAATGAARLSAAAAARSGAGLVTVLAPADALPVHAAHLTSIMLAPCGTDEQVQAFIAARKINVAVLGSAFGDFARARELAGTVLGADKTGLKMLVLDADALTAFKDEPQDLFNAVAGAACQVVLTPHEGEFQRLFDALVKTTRGKVEVAREAARRSHCIVVYKGADTVIAAPDGRTAINSNGNSLLATAGSGDVLSGIIAGLAAQGMPGFEAACAAVWMHGEVAEYYAEQAPAGMIAEDMPELLPQVWKRLKG